MKTFIQSVRNWYGTHILSPMNNAPLRKRILLSNLIINLFLVLITASWATGSIYRQMEAQSSYAMQKGFDQAVSFLHTRLENALDLSESIIFNNSLNSILNKEHTGSIDINTDARAMRHLIRGFESQNGIEQVRIYVDDTWDMAMDGQNIFPLSQLSDPVLLEKLFARKGIRLFVGNASSDILPPSGQDVISLYRVMYSTNNYNKISFVLRIDMAKRELIELLSNINLTHDSFSFLVDQDRTIIASSGRLSDAIMEDDALTQILDLPKGYQTDITLRHDKYLILTNAIDLTDWSMVTLVPYSSFFMDFQNTALLIFLAAFLILLVSLLLFYLISYSITKRILILCNHIKETESGELIPISAPEYRDEIGLLYRSYNHMIVRIKQLMRENYNMGRNLKNAEYKALQSQINPHFLYNTLDMISWFSMQNKSEDINDVVYSLARFYKISLSKGMDIITIGEEIELTDCYISIQKHRFSNRIQYNKDIDPDILDYSIPKITIQPLVENAIFHGILEKATASGTLGLRGRIEDGIIHITLSDDGKGMDSASTILNGDSILASSADAGSSDNQGSHYGLKNIILRLKLLYGSEYGLSIESAHGAGTIIHLNIPAVRPEQAATPPCDLSFR